MKLPITYVAYVVIAVIVVAAGYTYYRASAQAQMETRLSILNHSVEAIDGAPIPQVQKDAIFSALFVDIPPTASLKFPFTLGIGKSDAAGPGQGRKGPRPGPGASSSAPTCPPSLKNTCKESGRAYQRLLRECGQKKLRANLDGEFYDCEKENNAMSAMDVDIQSICQVAGCPTN